MDKIYDELNKEEQYPAQSAYVGFLLTDLLSTRYGMRIANVELENNCLRFEMAVDLHGVDHEVEDTATFFITSNITNPNQFRRRNDIYR